MLSTALKSKLATCRFLVADTLQTGSLIESYLRGMGAKHIVCVADGRAAIDVLNRTGQRIETIIYDTDLPGLAGLDALQLVGQQFGRLPCVFISANVTPE